MTRYAIGELQDMPREELNEVAFKLGIEPDADTADLVFLVLQAQARNEGYLLVTGVFEQKGDAGFGFLRRQDASFDRTDVYISTSQVAELGLRGGEIVSAAVRIPFEEERYFALVRIEAINGLDPKTARRRGP